ncbi:MAG: SUMF1/EgtB/PvdO family nonheme iron enzyme [Candidatus Competibacteraceae bacterium]
MRLSGNPDASINRLVEYLRDRAGLLFPRGVGVYTFPHRSFQEYLTACHLTGDDEYPDNIAKLARHEPDRWREVALLAGAKAARGAYASLWALVRELCFREPDADDVETSDTWGAQIAAQALVETADLSRISQANQGTLARIKRWLLHLMRNESLPATERALAGNNLALLGDPRFDSDCWYLPTEPLLGFVEIPAGDFLMGDGEEQHKVSLPRYYLARWPVTVAQFAAFVKASGYFPAYSRSAEGVPSEPVRYVSWHDAMAYCRWLNDRLRQHADKCLATAADLSPAEAFFWRGLSEGSLGVGLPSEAEWEKAARGIDGRTYPWGPDADPNRANYDETKLNAPTVVGCFPGGQSPYGCKEMSGNVWEWTRSLWGKTGVTLMIPEMDGRICRLLIMCTGCCGAARSTLIRGTLAARRDHYYPVYFLDDLGFRVVASPFFSDR